MSIGSIGSSAFSPYFAVNSRSLAKNAPSDTVATPATQSPSSLGDFSGLTVQESHLALRIRTRTSLHTSEDGTVSERSSSKLQFHYDLTTADGQHIELNVKAKVQQSSSQDAAGNSVSTTRVKLQFSLLQEGVAEGLSPLQSEETPSDTRSGIAGGLQAFLDSVGEALQQFTEGENNSADDLIKKTVDAFNSLLGALTNLLFPQAENAEAPALPASSEQNDPVPAIATPVPVVTAPVVTAPGDTVLSPLPPVAESPPPAASDAEAPAVLEDPIPADEFAPDVEPAATEENDVVPAESAPAVSPTQVATQVLRDVRIRFVQSLTQIIGTLTPADQSGTSSLAVSQYLHYQSSLSLRIHSASLVDVNA